MENNTEKLMALKQKIEEAKKNKTLIEGQLISLLENIKEYNCNSIEELKIKLEELEINIIEKQEQLNIGIEELGGEFKW